MENEIIQVLVQKVQALEKEVSLLRQKRVYQGDIIPDQVKQRALGEGNRFMRAGLAADLPTVGEPVADNSTPYFFARDTSTLYIWTGSAWVSEVLT